MQSLVKLFNRRTGAKTALVLLTITIFVFAFASMTTSAPGITYGDVNNDGRIDVRDVVLVMQYIIGLKDLTEDQLKAADVNGDGEVNVQDVTMIMRHVLNVETIGKAIKEVEEVEINVFINNPADRLYFPDKVKATLSDDTTKELEVEWDKTSTPPYVKEEVGEYVFEGELVNLPWGINNPDGIKARAVVNVLMYDTPRLPTPVPGFDLFGLTLVVNPSDAGIALINGLPRSFGEFEEGDIVEISVLSSQNYEFKNWTWNGDLFSDDKTVEFEMPAENVLLIANFETDDPPVTDDFESLGGEVVTLVAGVFNVSLSFDLAEAAFPGITQDDVIILSVTGKDDIILEYSAARNAFFKASVQGYTETEINRASVRKESPEDPDPVTAADLNVEFGDILPGVFNVWISYSDAQAGLTGVTTNSVLILDVAGKDSLELEYNSVRDAFFKPAVQGYSKGEIEDSLVTVE